jgi:hypothetical protein
MNSAVLRPKLGGMLELFGVLGGRLSLTRNSAISPGSAAASAVSRSIASARAKQILIAPSGSSESSVARFMSS